MNMSSSLIPAIQLTNVNCKKTNKKQLNLLERKSVSHQTADNKVCRWFLFIFFPCHDFCKMMHGVLLSVKWQMFP